MHVREEQPELPRDEVRRDDEAERAEAAQAARVSVMPSTIVNASKAAANVKPFAEKRSRWAIQKPNISDASRASTIE